MHTHQQQIPRWAPPTQSGETAALELGCVIAALCLGTSRRVFSREGGERRDAYFMHLWPKIRRPRGCPTFVLDREEPDKMRAFRFVEICHATAEGINSERNPFLPAAKPTGLVEADSSFF